jgi:flagellar motor switch protein FliG
MHDVTTQPSLPSPLPAPGALTRLQKAAVIYRMLGSLGMALPEGALADQERAALEREIGALDGIAPDTLAGVVDEFLSALAPNAPAAPEPPRPIGPPGMALPELPLLDPPPDESPQAPDPWERIANQTDDALLARLDAEAPEVGAVLMSKLRVSRAAELLSRLPGPLARRITYCISLIDGISPATVARIGEALAGEFSQDAPRVFSEDPVERVGAILNFSRAKTRNDMLDGLHETDPRFADAVRKSIFTFANIPARIGPRDVPKILREVDQKDLVTALAGAGATEEFSASAEFLLANISQRMATSLREEIAELGEVAASDSEAAMGAIVATIRALEESGDIYLVAEED